jgi:hypothetical protein
VVTDKLAEQHLKRMPHPPIPLTDKKWTVCWIANDYFRDPKVPDFTSLCDLAGRIAKLYDTRGNYIE